MAVFNRFSALLALFSNTETDVEGQIGPKTWKEYLKHSANKKNQLKDEINQLKKRNSKLLAEKNRLRKRLYKDLDRRLFINSKVVQWLKSIAFFNNGFMIYTTILLSLITCFSFKGYTGQGPKNADVDYIFSTQTTLLFCLGEHFGAFLFILMSTLFCLENHQHRPFALFSSYPIFIPLIAFIISVLSLSNAGWYFLIIIPIVSAAGSFIAHCLGTDEHNFKICIIACFAIRVLAFTTLGIIELSYLDLILRRFRNLFYYGLLVQVVLSALYYLVLEFF